MKKLLSIFLILALLFTFTCGCKKESKKKDSGVTSVDNIQSDVVSSEQDASSEETPSQQVNIIKVPKEEVIVEKVPIENNSESEGSSNSTEEEEIDRDKEVRERMQGGINFNDSEGSAMPEDKNHYLYQREYYDLVAKAGYNNIRFPIGLSNMIVTEGPEYLLDTEQLRRLDIVVNNALNAGLIIAIDNHHGSEYYNKEKFVRVWEQIAERYQKYPPELIFELVNEPNGLSDDIVNDSQMAAAEVIRKTNPTRNIVLAPNSWNGYWKIWDTEVPSKVVDGKLVFDPNVIIAVHCYAPMNFTHQGAMSEDNHVAHLSDDPSTLDYVTQELEVCADYEKRTGRTVWINEWGAWQDHADDDCMSIYYKHATSEMARLDLAYAVWEFWTGYGIYDKSNNKLKDYIVENMVVSW